MQIRYDQEARDRQVAIIGSCGFDSLMADLGVECVRQDCEQKNLNITLIESFLLLRSGHVSVSCSTSMMIISSNTLSRVV